MPAVAIETVVIVIVVISCAVLAAVIFALYWLWHLLLEDRRCSRSFERDWQRQSIGPLLGEQQQPRVSVVPSSVRHHQHRTTRVMSSRNRREMMLVDERSRRRMLKPDTSGGNCYTPPTTASRGQCTETAAIADSVTHSAALETPDVVVIDGTEPPPPYEEVTR